MDATTTPTYFTTFIRSDRPCVACDGPTVDGDRYCALCGTPVADLADRILAWRPDPNRRSLEERPCGAALAKQVRQLLKPFAPAVSVRTQGSYYVRVRLAFPELNAAGLSPRTAPYRVQWHAAHHRAAEDHVRTILHRFFFRTDGIRNNDPGADYPYLSLPVLTVNGL